MDYITEPVITTCTIAFDSNLNDYISDFAVLSHAVPPDYKRILAVKSTVLDIEKCKDNYFTKAAQIQKRRERAKIKQQMINFKPARILSGNGYFFQSSVEYVIRDPNTKNTKLLKKKNMAPLVYEAPCFPQNINVFLIFWKSTFQNGVLNLIHHSVFSC